MVGDETTRTSIVTIGAMTRIRLRLCRGYRTDVVEVPLGDLLLGTASDCHVVVDGAAARHAWLRPRRGQLLLAPGSKTGRRPAIAGTRIEAPVVLAPGRAFQLSSVSVTADVLARPGLVGQTIGGWVCTRELAGFSPARRSFEAIGPDGPGRVHQVEGASPALATTWPGVIHRVPGVVVWAEPGPVGLSLATVLEAHAAGAVTWPVEAGVVLLTQLTEALCEYHDRSGPHGALRPELIYVDVNGRVALSHPDPWAVDYAYQPERIRLGGVPDPESDTYSWWRIAHQILDGFALRLPILLSVRARLPRPPADRAELLAASEAVRRWAIDGGLDPTAVHLARGIRLADSLRAVPLARVGARAPAIMG